jgi:hypothetical protein
MEVLTVKLEQMTFFIFIQVSHNFISGNKVWRKIKIIPEPLQFLPAARSGA